MSEQIISNLCKIASMVLIILMTGCSHSVQKDEKNPAPGILTIDIEAALNQMHEFPVSLVASDITYIPLESPKQYLINKIRQIRLTESSIFIADDNRLLQFNRDGKFVKQIGKKGRGPGEYSGIMHFDVNEQADRILIQGEYESNTYNLNGDFIQNPKFQGSLFYFCNSSRIAFYSPTDEKRTRNLLITDKNLNPLYEFHNHNPRPVTRLKHASAPFYHFKNNLYFKEHYNDTVVSVNDSTLTPHIILREGSLLLDKNFDLQPTGNWEDLKKQLEKVKDQLTLENIWESNRFIFITYIKGVGPLAKSRLKLIYDKKTLKLYASHEKGFINDFDNGIDFWPAGVFHDSLMVYYSEAFELKSHVTSNAFRNSNPLCPVEKKKLEQLVNSLNENDNPVLMIVKLKE